MRFLDMVIWAASGIAFGMGVALLVNREFLDGALVMVAAVWAVLVWETRDMLSRMAREALMFRSWR